MLERLADLEREYEEVLARLSDNAVLSDMGRLREESRKHKQLEPIVTAYRAYRSATEDLGVAKELGMKDEVEVAERRMAELEEELNVLLLPKDENVDKNVIVEIRGAEGGEEANLFARDLFEMYSRYADRLGYKLEVLNTDASDMGGFNEVTFLMKGENVWTRMKFEGGVHRVQRVPTTESQGRIHTSSATVTVLPEAEEVDFEIDMNDLEFDVYRSSGPGGQSVNTTDSAVRVTHKPTGVVVAMQDEKSQIQNRAKALVVLRSRLLKLEQDRKQAELSVQRKGQIGTGSRSEKVRTYNFKENRVSDHRVNLTLYKLDKILGAGELDEITEALIADERARQLAGE